MVMALSRILAAAAVLHLLPLSAPAAPQARQDTAVEERIVRYLRENVKPGERLVVSHLYNEVFKSLEERKVLDRLFNTFFKIPIFVAQYYASTAEIPTLADISRQFNLPVEGEADVILSIIDSDPRIPKFIKRDPQTGEIVSVDVEAVRSHRQFGQLLERTLMGWVGRSAPAFEVEMLNGGKLSSNSLQGKHHLLYFWFSGCPPCVRISPHLVELQRRYASRNFTVVAVNADRYLELETTDADREAYLKKTGTNFPVAHLTGEMQESYGNVNVYPTLFLVDADGVVRKHYVNYQPLDVLAADVEAQLGGAGSDSHAESSSGRP